MILYHITKEKYLPSILTDGLKINSGKTGFCNKSSHSTYKKYYGMQPIFLTNDVDFIIKTMLTSGWILKNKAIILEVNIELNDNNSNCGWYDGELNPKEFRYFFNIESKNIKLSNIGV